MSAAGLTAVVARMRDGANGGGHGVLVLDTRHPDGVRALLLSADEWRGLLPLIEAQCAVAEGHHPAQQEGGQHLSQTAYRNGEGEA